MLLVLFSLHGVTFESLAHSAFGSSCWLWEIPCIDFEKKTKLFQTWLGKGLENSSFWHSSIVLILGSACVYLVRGTKGILAAVSVLLQAGFTALSGLRVTSDSGSFDLLWMRNEQRFLQLPWLWPKQGSHQTFLRWSGGCASPSYFGLLFSAALQLTRKAFWQPAPFPTPQAAEKLWLPPPTHAKLFLSPQGKLKI